MSNEALDKAVIELNGVLPPSWTTIVLNTETQNYEPWPPRRDAEKLMNIGTGAQFTQRAKGLGFINGYRWGVEYATNGKRPDLPKDTKVSCSIGGEWKYDDDYSDEVDYWNWPKVQAFKVLDPRYKPADTSYLQTPAVEPVEEVAQVDLPALSIAISDAVSIAAELGKTEVAKQLQAINKVVLHDDATRKADLEKKRVVTEAQKICANFASKDLGALYDAGYLRLPANKD